MKIIYIIEFGSSYSSEPWEIVGFCETEKEAQAFVSKQLTQSLYHITKVKKVK